MAMFEGYKCPVCEKTFDKQDDIVVCPECGAPYHRECYMSNSGCVYADRHAEGFTWSGVKESEPEVEATHAVETIRCARCGTENPVTATVCSDCGAYLRAPSYTGDDSDIPGASQNNYPPFVEAIDPEQLENEVIDDIRVGDLKSYLGSSWVFSIPSFYSIGKYGRKLSFNILALLTHGIWFIWKKMYGIGVLILSLMTGIYVFQIAVSDLVEPLVECVDNADTAGIMAFIEANPALSNAYMFCGILQIAIYAYCALNSNNAHYRHCLRKIKKLRTAHADSDEEYKKSIENAGNSSFAAILIAVLAYTCIQMLAVKYSGTIVQLRDLIYTFFTSGDLIARLRGIF